MLRADILMPFDISLTPCLPPRRYAATPSPATPPADTPRRYADAADAATRYVIIFVLQASIVHWQYAISCCHFDVMMPCLSMRHGIASAHDVSPCRASATLAHYRHCHTPVAAMAIAFAMLALLTLHADIIRHMPHGAAYMRPCQPLRHICHTRYAIAPLRLRYATPCRARRYAATLSRHYARLIWLLLLYATL